MKGGPSDKMSTTMNACLACRKMKMKCYVGDTAQSRCRRCAKKSLDCVFLEHRRGRKPGTRLSNPGTGTSSTDHVAETSTSERQRKKAWQRSSYPPHGRSEDLSSQAMANSLQPSGVLNRNAMKGRFSLHDLLVPGDSDEQSSAVDADTSGNEDPVLLGLVNLPIAKSLYDSFILVLNPFVSHLDPKLHTFAYVRQTSSFLLAAALTASAKAFHPVLYQKLYQHSQNLLTAVFRQGIKSVEVVQAILILTYWKEPHDNRVWTTVGYAIRICMDLGWHRLETYRPDDQSTTDELEQRQIRNVQRTWLVLFVYDRSISLQTGKPYMIESDGLIESIEDWTRDHIAIENDQLLGALVTLRLETSAAFTFMISRQRYDDRAQPGNLGPLVSILNRRIDTWESTWSQAVEKRVTAEEESCHGFLIRFYGLHLRLQLSSLQLEGVLSSGRSSPPNLDSLWIAYSSALQMLRLIPTQSNHLNFAQDSVHIMLAYSAAFLLKLLHLAPRTIAEQLEADIISAVHEAASSISTLPAASGSSSALQARFLRKIADKLRRTQSRDDGSVPAPGPVDTGPTLHPSDVQIQDFSMCPGGSMDFSFPENGSWDDIFASAGLDMDSDIYLQ